MKFRLLIILIYAASFCYAQGLKVMTYNIRFDNPSDGVNQWSSRKEKVFSLLKKYNPDVIGVQEALHHQMQDIVSNVPGYAYVGVGRDDGRKGGEFSAILYKKDRFEILEQNTFWLSESPSKPGSKSWDAAITRVASWAKVKDKIFDRTYILINTHFDHIGKEARKNSATLLKQKISELGFELPVVVTGDFNCTRDEEPYAIMTNNELVELIDPASNIEGTYCTFQVGVECKAIDYIFLTNEWQADAYTVLHDNDGKHYPSDHLPVMITLTLQQ